MSEYAGIGVTFVGMGFFVILGVSAYFLYQMSRFWRQLADREGFYTEGEKFAGMKYFKSKGIDFDEIEAKQSQSFRKRLEKEIIDDFFREKESKSKK